jgi:hypothetical protein
MAWLFPNTTHTSDAVGPTAHVGISLLTIEEATGWFGGQHTNGAQRRETPAGLRKAGGRVVLGGSRLVFKVAVWAAQCVQGCRSCGWQGPAATHNTLLPAQAASMCVCGCVGPVDVCMIAERPLFGGVMWPSWIIEVDQQQPCSTLLLISCPCRSLRLPSSGLGLWCSSYHASSRVTVWR